MLLPGQLCMYYLVRAVKHVVFHCLWVDAAFARKGQAGHDLCHRWYRRDTETLSCKCKSRAEGLIRLSVSLSSKFPSLSYVRETLQKR
jgi:hypothetical protein